MTIILLGFSVSAWVHLSEKKSWNHPHPIATSSGEDLVTGALLVGLDTIPLNLSVDWATPVLCQWFLNLPYNPE